jgi:hypothetical protein
MKKAETRSLTVTARKRLCSLAMSYRFPMARKIKANAFFINVGRLAHGVVRNGLREIRYSFGYGFKGLQE